MRHGRVFFMGDSAKVVSPFGARGGNTGIADADNLAWKLAAVVQGRAAPALLDSYHEERHEAARQNVMVTNRTARFLRPATPVEKVFRDAALSLARQQPFARQFVNTGRMAVANPYSRSSACDRTGGQSVQNVSFAWPDGSPGRVNDLLRWADGRCWSCCSARWHDRPAAPARPVRNGADALRAGAGPGRSRRRAGARARPKGHLQGACHVFGHAWALVRPDSYVAATGETVDAALVHAVGQALGTDAGRGGRMKTQLNLQDADGFYEQLLDAHEGCRSSSRRCSMPG
jgi:3-(3-hydroxy-phenyl)propionate hydroxylase